MKDTLLWRLVPRGERPLSCRFLSRTLSAGRVLATVFCIVLLYKNRDAFNGVSELWATINQYVGSELERNRAILSGLIICQNCGKTYYKILAFLMLIYVAIFTIKYSSVYHILPVYTAL
jgi:hypothetical protein